MDYKPESVNLKAIIAEIIEVLKPSASITKTTIKNFQTDTILAYADQNMLKTILYNLISNAIKITNTNGEIKVYVITNQTHVEITISDNGIGVNEEIRNILFSID